MILVTGVLFCVRPADSWCGSSLLRFFSAEQVPRRAPPAGVHVEGSLPGGVLHLLRLPRLPRDVRGAEGLV